MTIRLMVFTDQPAEPHLDELYAYLDLFEGLKGQELTGHARSWGIGMNGPKLTRKGAIRGYYWQCQFNEVKSEKVRIVFDRGITPTERARLLKRLTEGFGGTTHAAPSAIRRKEGEVQLYVLDAFDHDALNGFFGIEREVAPGSAVMMP